MATKYITKNKDGKWAVKNAKAAKASKNFETQKEAIIYAVNLQSTKAVLVQDRHGKFRAVSNWDLREKEETNKTTKKKKVNKTTKVTSSSPKTNKFSTIAWILAFIIIIGGAVVGGLLIAGVIL